MVLDLWIDVHAKQISGLAACLEKVAVSGCRDMGMAKEEVLQLCQSYLALKDACDALACELCEAMDDA